MFTTRQLMFGIATFIGGSSLFTVFITQITHQDSWLTALLALALSLLVVLLYTALMQKFPGQGLLQIHSLVYGASLGRLINLFYTLFCMAFSAVSLRNLGDFFTSYIMPETPTVVVMSLLAITCALAAKSGIAIVLRNAFLFFVLMCTALIINSLMLLPDVHLYNFLPALQLGLSAYVKGSFVLATAPFCEIIVFFILLPYADKKADVRKSFFWGLLLGAFYLLITFLRDIAVLGISLSYLTEPTYEAVRLIHLMDVFSRLEIVFAFILIVMRVFKMSVLFCAVLRSIEDTIGRPLQKRGLGILAISIITVLAAMYLFPTGITLPDWFRTVGAFGFGIFEMLLPLLTLCIALLRRRSLNLKKL